MAWHTWVRNDGTTSSTDGVWVDWCSNATTTTATAATIGDKAWIIWCTTSNTLEAVRNYTPEQVRQMAEAEERWRKQAEEEKAKREAAEKRAQKLLEANLALEERNRLRKHSHIFVRGRSGQRYRVRKGRVANVDVVDKEGYVTHRLCAHPAAMLPDFDTMLAQKLMLEHDDEAFGKIANRHDKVGTVRVMEPLH